MKDKLKQVRISAQAHSMAKIGAALDKTPLSYWIEMAIRQAYLKSAHSPTR